jgi:hypothetical protein
VSFSTCVNSHRTIALLDNSSEGYLVDYSHAQAYICKLPTLKLTNPFPLNLGNSKLYCMITEAVLVDLEIGDHHERLLCYLTDIPRYQTVLGDKWLCEYNPVIDWRERGITFNSSHITLRKDAYA